MNKYRYTVTFLRFPAILIIYLLETEDKVRGI